MRANTVLHVYPEKPVEAPYQLSGEIDVEFPSPLPFVGFQVPARDESIIQVEHLSYDNGSWLVFYTR